MDGGGHAGAAPGWRAEACREPVEFYRRTPHIAVTRVITWIEAARRAPAAVTGAGNCRSRAVRTAASTLAASRSLAAPGRRYDRRAARVVSLPGSLDVHRPS